MALLREWAQGFCPLNAIERSLSDLIDARGSDSVERTGAVVTAEDAMAMLEPGDVLIDCTGSRSLLRDHLVPGAGERGRGREHTQHPARIRAGHHLPVRPAVRLQRVLQVLQERGERAVQVHSGGPPHVLRRQHHPRDGHRQHHRRGLRGDAAAIRWRVASRQLPRRRGVDGPLHRQDQAGNSRRDRRRSGDCPDTR